MTRSRFLGLLAGCAVAVLSVLPGAFGPSKSAGAAQAQDSAAIEITDMALGAEDAPVTVIEYASFTCPHCARFHDSVFKDLKANYIDTGKVRFIHREVFFDRYGLWAGIVARCGGPERYFGIADLVYANQNDWTASSDPAVVAGNLRRIGKTAGLSDAQLDACLTDGAKAQALVAWYQENARADGIDSTPAFVIDGETHGNMSYSDFAALIDAQLGD